MRLMENTESRGKVINIGGDQEVSIMTLAERVKALAGSPSEIVTIPYEQVYPHGFEDMMRRKPDVTRLHSLTGFRPKTSLDDIILDIIAEKKELAAA